MIKISYLRSSLHDNKALDKINKQFISEINEKLGEELKLTSLDDYDADLKLIFIESGGSEGLFLNALDTLREPYYLLTSGNNNSLAASMEILTYLNLNHKKGEILHGSTTYIAERIRELSRVSHLKKELAKMRLGIIGNPSDWLISSIPAYKVIKDRLGVELIDIDINELIKAYNEAKIEDYNENISLEFNPLELDCAKRMYVAINNIKNSYRLDGLTIRCFDLLGSCKTTSCLAFALLNSKGIIASCEGDIMSMLTMAICRLYFNEESFQANPSRIDVESREIVFAHCTIPFSMLKGYKLDTHFESGIGVAVKGELALDDITIIRMSSDMEHYFAVEGKIERNLNERNLCRTQILVKSDNPIDTLLTNPCGNHHIIIYGKHKNEVDSLMKYLGLKKY